MTARIHQADRDLYAPFPQYSCARPELSTSSEVYGDHNGNHRVFILDCEKVYGKE